MLTDLMYVKYEKRYGYIVKDDVTLTYKTAIL